ncbi:hypothetical protein TCAL_09460 [Tigriopus californicus]|uniref:Ionotropic glutamate receptor C-terminal domain-containing protein n=2 Tax=Tigriopus californicus TaxID=6832 RepID=A0A553PM58_TIGCA|nr:hypothetical protein TCAL_09460 [Tigriopus californicus]|eukprot:TCALIF_09460-PA protein Name:"Similar to GRID1 Glutamate receptor ionotropic, delta-1 (Homo sapiens)" AED:0.02 eAED:0.02 QI:0/-1/0/1/-1/1/1/0/362
MKFKIIVVHPPDGKWGGITKNGSWNGMIGQLVRGEADMAMSEFTINEDRQKVVDYSIPLMDDSVHFSILRSSEGTSWLLFLNTFSYEFWASVAASLLITFIVLRFVMFKAQETLKEGSIFGATLLIFLSQSQFSFDFGSKSGRILFLASSVLGTIIFTAFSASLTSQFTVEQQSLPLESLEELIQHPEFEFGVQKSSSYETYFSSGVPGSLRHQIYEEFIRSRPENYVQDNKDGFQRSMEDSQFIYLVKKTTYVNSDVICRIVQSPRAIYKIQKAFVFQKVSPYTELFNYNIKNLIEMGGLNRLKRNFMKPLDLSLCGQQETIELGYEKVFTAFLPLVFGVALSVLILIFEVCFVRMVYVII